MRASPEAEAVVVGAGVIGLCAARALSEEGFAVRVHEQFSPGTRLGSSSGASRIYRRAYHRPEYVRLARRAIEEWRRIDASLLVEDGLFVSGARAKDDAASLAACGEPFEWLEPAEAERLFPEARFDGPVLFDREAGVLQAERAIAHLAEDLEIHHDSRIADPRSLAADVVVVCSGPWLPQIFDLPLRPRIEQVSYFSGAGERRPAFVDHGNGQEPIHYGAPTAGLGYKVGAEAVRPGEFDPDQPGRPLAPEVDRQLEAYVSERLPGLEPRARHSETCLVTVSPDEDFVLDRIDGVILCGGDSGHAFKLAPVLGRLIADLAQGRPLGPEGEMFRVGRFQRGTSATGSPPGA